jgi:hypothetical protein
MSSTLKCPPWGGSFDHSVGMADAISHRPLIHDHPNMPKVGGSSQQHQGFDEERGLSVSQQLKYTVEFSESIRPAVHRSMTLWALSFDTAGHERAYGPRASLSYRKREGKQE